MLTVINMHLTGNFLYFIVSSVIILYLLFKSFSVNYLLRFKVCSYNSLSFTQFKLVNLNKCDVYQITTSEIILFLIKKSF